MSLQSDAPRASTVFAITEAAHTELVQLRDHLRLMAQLTAVGTNASRHDARLRPDALAWNFSRMAKELDGIVASSSFSTQLVDAYDSAHKNRKGRAAPKS
ncbi:hypothetical protein LK996_07060 [Lysobacter sp. A6]|uniref:XAC0095-like domain-containing protein n=1 Tax=Noviluteimonas lactosilytica TaxID=2888523 RepID=A0ABS8JH50_9GAMM|nr:hypothetical protein [Lysobacter lactosilyticus]MCC8362835.1 hypothetical protein [Lysobacter lactosilyticus]